MILFRLVAIAALALGAGASAYAQANQSQFQSFQECAVGKRVSTNTGRNGMITRLDKVWSYPIVRFDEDGKEVSMLYSLLNSAEGSPLATGDYECIGNGRNQAGRMRIDGPNTYSFGGASGRHHIEPTGKIVFKTGPYITYDEKRVQEGRNGLNLNGGSFYATTCELNRNLR